MLVTLNNLKMEGLVISANMADMGNLLTRWQIPFSGVESLRGESEHSSPISGLRILEFCTLKVPILGGKEGKSFALF